MLAPRSLALALLVLALGSASVAAQPDDVSGVLRDWDKRRGAVRTARYVVKWEEFPIQQRPGDPKPGTDGLHTGTSQVLFDFEKGRYRYRRDGVLPTTARGKLVRQVRTHRYDGREESTALEVVQAAASAPADPSHANLGPWTSGFTDFREVAPLLWGHGIHWTEQDHTDDRFPLALTRQPDRYEVARREAVEGRPGVVLRDFAGRAGIDLTLLVEPGRNSAIVRERVERGGQVSTTTATYRQHPEGWFPERWTVHAGEVRQPPREAGRYVVEKVEFNPAVTDDDFRIALKPGMDVVQDGKTFKVAADGTLARATPDGPPGGTPPDEGTPWVGAAVIGLLVLLIALALGFRRRRVKRGVEGS